MRDSNFFSDVGLDYLPLERAGDILSGGEAQRIRLAEQIGSGLTGVTIVLDEPTIGLYPKDNKKLIAVLKSLKKDGATVIAVEHDEATLCSAEWIIDLGPKGRRFGGEIVAQGPVDAILKSEDSLTGKINGLDVEIPLGCLIMWRLWLWEEHAHDRCDRAAGKGGS
ncbi:MAG: hypothetical protein ACUVQ2_06575 [Dissulfurimicrobium sp.]|uniref:hypothetical protein n=1 Tax=Dissulfurimicrobium sp. TaxID=2022436 RepID=UPI004048FAF4